MKHRALIVGAGRIGAGYNWIQTPYPYTHADTYLALKDRVELVGFIEPDKERREAATKKYGIDAFHSVEVALHYVPGIDIVSICTQPEQRWDILTKLDDAMIPGVWCEKPFACPSHMTLKDLRHIAINYWRRYEPMHRRIKDKLDAGEYGEVVRLVVSAKRDIHTVSHFTDLALWWNVPQSKFTYCDVPASDFTTCEYTLYATQAVLRFEGGGSMMTEDHGGPSHVFPGMRLPFLKDARAWSPIFMTEALSDLLNVMDGITAKTKSGPEGAIEAERWAEEILR